jgi:hypothetical protein
MNNNKNNDVNRFKNKLENIVKGDFEKKLNNIEANGK